MVFCYRRAVYYAVADPAILRFMVEVYWGQMLAAFSATLDHSDDREATFLCLQGYRHAVHVTAVIALQALRDAFVQRWLSLLTSTVKVHLIFPTFLHM